MTYTTSGHKTPYSDDGWVDGVMWYVDSKLINYHNVEVGLGVWVKNR